MTDIDIDAIRQRLNAATEGPWEHGGNDGLVWPPRIGDPVSGSTETADAEFIAHARTDVPALLAKVDELTAALTESREQAATYANEVGTLTAENARVRQQRDGLVADLTDAGNEVDLLTAENTRLRPVVEAAKTWRAQFEKPVDTKLPRMAALMAAIDALPKAEATR